MTPEVELMILLEAAEDAWSMVKAADTPWYRAHPGESDTIDSILEWETAGRVRLVDEPHPDDGRVFTWVRLTPAGQDRIAELVDQGVQPAPAVDADDPI